MTAPEHTESTRDRNRRLFLERGRALVEDGYRAKYDERAEEQMAAIEVDEERDVAQLRLVSGTLRKRMGRWSA